MKILVVEDESYIRENIQELLEIEGYIVTTADDGCTALEIARTNVPDLILCDVMLPELDGYGVLSSLRQTAATASIPLIFLTAMSRWSDMRFGMTLGADDYLIKPFSANELLRAIAVRLSKQNLIKRQTQTRIQQQYENLTNILPRELLAPLNDMMGLIQILIEEHGTITDSEALDIAATLYGSGQSLHRLIQNLLIFTKLEWAAREPDQILAYRSKRNRSLSRDLITEVAMQKAKDFNRQADLFLEVRDYIVHLAESNLKKLVDEIIDNAFKFSNPGTPVRIMAWIEDGTFVLNVSNLGSGMTQRQIAEVGTISYFTKPQRDRQGAGLGLSIAKRLVDLCGGNFHIISIPHQKTVVQVRLPGETLYTPFKCSDQLSIL